MNRKSRRASISNGKRLMKKGWNPWEDLTVAVKLRGMEIGRNVIRIMKNNLYIVQEFHKETDQGKIILLMCRRNDESPIRSWSDLQRIKNELVGVDKVAVEVFPRNVELVDQANMYHLWVLPEGFKLPFGLHMMNQ